MARASAAGASARAEAWQTFAFKQAPLLVRIRASLRRPDRERIARWFVPAALALFVALLAGASYIFLIEEQERVVAAAATDVDFVASVVAENVNLRMQVNRELSPLDALSEALPQQALGHGRRVLLSDTRGNVVASYPNAHIAGMIRDHLGDSDALTILAEKAGVLRLSLPDGSNALATIRSLRAPLGQVAIIHPMADVLSQWRTALYRIVLLLICVGSVLSALAAAYLWQATRARRADSSCKVLRDKFDLVLSRGRCGLWDWDLTSGRIEWSLSMYQILGMVPKTQSAIEINGLIHPEDGNLDEMLRLLSVGQNSAIDHIFRMRNAAGSWTWLRAKAEIVAGPGIKPHLVGVAIDVTETMELQQRTADADVRLRDAIDTISEAFVVWDAENRLVMCNSKFQRFHDLPDNAVRSGTEYAAVMASGTPPIVQTQVPLGIAEPLGARTFEAQLGDGRWLQVNERRTKDGGYVSVGTDITALKRNEEQLIESERRLMDSIVDLRKSRQTLETQAQQLAELAEKYLEQKAAAENANRAKSDFLANMGHELRTPLNAILGFSEIMMMESYGDLGSPLYQEYCKDIHASGHYLCNVITDLLEMSRLDAGRVRLEKSEFDLGTTIESAMTSVRAAAEASAIAISSNVAADTKLFADQAAITKVMTALLNNAVKYTSAGGRVTIQTRAVQSVLNITIEDTGIGISPEEIARLGRPFEQSDKILKDGMRGSGLGLAIARSLVELHEGTMRIKSKPGIGTVVVVHLPNRKPHVRPPLHLATNAVSTLTPPPRFTLHSAERTRRKISRTA